MLGEYIRNGRHNPRWDDAAHTFIESALPWWAGCRDVPTRSADLLPLADNALRLGCNDPVVLLLAGRAKVAADPQSADASLLIARALEAFRDTPYPRGVACVAAAEFVEDCDRRRDGTGQADPAKKLWLQWFGQSLTDGSYAASEQVALALQLGSGRGQTLFKQHRAQCAPALDAAGSSVAPWLRLWLSGARHIDDAWEARGSDVGSKVTAAGWRGFAAEIASARRDLTASWQLNPHRPEAAAAMVTVAMAENGRTGETERLWFDRAVTAQIDYHHAYRSMVYALYPRWGGSQRAMIAFGRACAKTNLYSTGVPMELHAAMQHIGWDAGNPAAGFRDPELYAALETVFAGYEADATQQNRRPYFHGWHARAASLAGHDEDAYRLLREVDFRLTPDVVEDLEKGQTREDFIGRLAVLSSPARTKALSAEQSMTDAGTADRALSLYKEAFEQCRTDPRAAKYLQEKIAILTTQEQLRSGQWLSLQPAAGSGGTPLGWRSKLGHWQVEADGSLTGRCGGSGLMLVNEARVGPDFEMRGEMDFLPGAANEVQSGVVFGHPDFEGEDWRSWRLKRNGREGAIAILSQHWYDGPKEDVPVPDHNTFDFQSSHGRMTLTINGREIFHERSLAKGLVDSEDSLVGLGGYSHQGNVFGVRYRNLQIRRLGAAPGVPANVPVQATKNLSKETIWR